MRRKPAKSKPCRSEAVKILLEHIAAPDAEERLARAYALILRAVDRAAMQGNAPADTRVGPVAVDRRGHRPAGQGDGDEGSKGAKE